MNRAGAGALVAAAACWGSLSVTTTIALRGFGPLTLLVGELAVAVVVLGAALRATGGRLPCLSWRLVALGSLEPGVAYLTFDLGVQRTSAAHAGLLLSSETVFVVVLGVIVLRERPSRLALAGVALAVAGVAVLTWQPGGHATLAGDLLVLLDSLAAAVSVILTARLVRDVRPLALTTAQFAIGLTAVLPVWAVAWLTGAEHPVSPHLSAAPVVALLITGGLGTASAFLIYAWALTRVGAIAAATATTLIPLYAVALSWLVLDEPLAPSGALSAVLILAGLVAYGFGEQRPTSGAAEEAYGSGDPPLVRAVDDGGCEAHVADPGEAEQERADPRCALHPGGVRG